MAKVSMVISDDVLAEIDASAGGNRTSFMVAASLDRARQVRRQREDREIADICSANAGRDATLDREWDATSGDGFE